MRVTTSSLLGIGRYIEIVALVALIVIGGCVEPADSHLDEINRSRTGTYLDWQPLPTDSVVTRIAFGSCAVQWDEQPIWNAVVASDPDLFLYLGDAIYGDFDGQKSYKVTEQTLNREWGVLAAVPAFQSLAANVPTLAVWDNHDYGKHDGGAEFPLKDVSKRIFLDFFGEPDDTPVRNHEGIYNAHAFGPKGRRVQVILLDTRYNKGPYELAEREEGAGGSLGKYAPNEDADVTLLGDAQWLWLEQQLKQPADIRFVASSTQIIPDQKGMDEWGNYPLERQRLFDLIDSTGAGGVILLTGNVHFTEVSKIEESVPYPLVDFTSSGLTHVNETYPKAANDYRVAGPLIDLNFGLVEIDWEVENGPLISLKAISLDGATEFVHTIRASELKPG